MNDYMRGSTWWICDQCGQPRTNRACQGCRIAELEKCLAVADARLAAVIMWIREHKSNLPQLHDMCLLRAVVADVPAPAAVGQVRGWQVAAEETLTVVLGNNDATLPDLIGRTVYVMDDPRGNR